MPVVHGLHGISENGDDSVGRILSRLDGIETRQHVYRTSGFAPLAAVQARMASYRRRIVEAVGDSVSEGDHVIAYSNGALIAYELMLAGFRLGVVVLFGAAVDRDRLFPSWGAERVIVVHNPDDRAVLAASMLIGHPWGQLGRRGHKFADMDDRVTNVEAGPRDAGWFGHNYFADSEVEQWAAYCRQLFF